MIKSYCWLTSIKTFGIVIIDSGSPDEPEKAYIGECLGENEKMDLKHIVHWGQKMDLEIAKLIISKHGTQYRPGQVGEWPVDKRFKET